MKRLNLVGPFRRRMLPLVALAALVVATSAPIAFYAQKRGELVSGARAAAESAGRLVREVAEERPRLWRYDAAKLAERLTAEGLHRSAALVIHDARGRRVPVDLGGPVKTTLLWGSTTVMLDGKLVASVWVGADPAALRVATTELALGFLILGLGLCALLYLIPVRAIAGAEQRLKTLTLTLQEDDRRRIARDLHDGAGQALTAARLRLVALKKSGAQVEAIAQHIDEALDEIRRSTSALLPPALVDLGLVGAVERHCKSFGDAAGLAVECQLSPIPELPSPVEIACYRIVQEALHNTVRHSKATRAWVRLEAVEGKLELSVGDDGVGLDPGERLDSIRERVRLIGGELSLSPKGVAVCLPLP